MNNLVIDTRVLSPEELKSSQSSHLMSLEEILPYLASPDSGNELVLGDGNYLTDGVFEYPLINKSPFLYPAYSEQVVNTSELKSINYTDARLQYLFLSKIKQMGEITANHYNVHAQRHFFRMKSFLSSLSGSILDVGCDDIFVSSALYPDHCRFIGLDPFRQGEEFRLIGIGEILPCKNNVFDNVVFNTSLDHILDYYEAVKEARRVLKSNGVLVLSTLIWTENSSLINDHVHFHHFKRYEIEGVLKALNFEAIEEINYSYKEDKNRYGLYIKARKVDG